jgi:dihydroxyacid dehydratase/phosphogluconate dehydratase
MEVKNAVIKGACKVVSNLIVAQLNSRDIVTKKSIENAVAVIMATGGSTNAVLHFLAIAHAAEVDWTIDDFERIRRQTPVLCDLKPSGKYLAIDLHPALVDVVDRQRPSLVEAGGPEPLVQAHAALRVHRRRPQSK